MSFTTPPTFSDDTVLSAAQLNILSSDIAYLEGLAGGVNVAFPRQAELRGEGAFLGQGQFWRMRHRSTALHFDWNWTVDAGNTDHLDITVTYAGSTIFSDGSVTGTGNSEEIIDLTPYSLTTGNWYEINVLVIPEDSGGTFDPIVGATDSWVNAIYESDS